MKVLLIEDNEDIIEGLIYSFKKEGIDLIYTTRVAESLEILNTLQIDAIVLDISLHDGYGLDLFNDVIKNKKIPTIVLTAYDDEDILVRALELGCEDYMTKPFRTKELFARIRKIYNRNHNSVVRSHDVEFDLEAMSIKKHGKEISVSGLELKILNLLFSNINKVVTRSQIIDAIWDWTGNDVEEHTVTVYLKRIREKIGDEVITTIKGVGYRIDGE